MDLLIALGLILIVYIICRREDKKRIAIKEEQRVNQIRSDQFQEQYANENVELTIKEKLSHLYTYSNEIWGELEPVFKNLSFCRNLTVDYIRNLQSPGEVDMIKRMLLAKRGLLPMEDARCVISHYDCINLPAQATQDSRNMRRIFKYVMTWCEQELQSHGVPVSLVASIISPASRSRLQKMNVLWREYRDPVNTGMLCDDICELHWEYQEASGGVPDYYLRDGVVYYQPVAMWERIFLDEALESRIRRLVEDVEGRIRLEPTLHKLLSDTPYEKYTRGKRLSSSVALDIILAGYGKVSRNASYWGYPADRYDMNSVTERRAFANTINEILHNGNTELLLCADKDVYAWTGSRCSVYGEHNLQDIWNEM